MSRSGARRSAIDAPLRVGPDFNEARIPQHPQVLGDRGLAHASPFDEVADRPLPVTQQVKDAPAVRLGEHVECLDHRVLVCRIGYMPVKA